MRSMVWLTLLLAGCTQLPIQPAPLSGCQGPVEPRAGQLQKAAFHCLEKGQLERAEQLLEHPQAAQAQADYHAYLHAQTRQLKLAAEPDPAARLKGIQSVHSEYVSLVKRYPQSAYLAHVKTQLLALHALAAQAEYDQALAQATRGQILLARQQMQHIQTHYRYGQAVHAARSWLATHAQ